MAEHRDTWISQNAIWQKFHMYTRPVNPLTYKELKLERDLLYDEERLVPPLWYIS